MTTIDESHCARCLRVPGPHDIGYEPEDDVPPAEWVVLIGSDGQLSGVVCPDCLTPAELQELDEDAMDLGNEAGPDK